MLKRPALLHHLPNAAATCVAGAIAVLTISFALALTPALSGHDTDGTWPMIGRDVENSRAQPDESRIGRRNVSRLRPKWEVTMNGDVSATPAVVNGAVYVPDWGGTFWKLDADSGRVIWSRTITSYTGVAGAISRTSPAYDRGTVFIGDLNGNFMAIDARTGNLLWRTRLDANPNTIVTASPIVSGNRVYITTSSAGGGVARTIFRGSMIALDARTGRIAWQTFMLPDNGGVAGGFAGGAFVNSPTIDPENGLIIAAAGQLYNQPASVTSCLAAAANGWDEACFPAGAFFNSVVALDLRTGAPRWSFRGAGPEARRLGCGEQPAAWCPAWENNFSTWDFAGSSANVFTLRGRGGDDHGDNDDNDRHDGNVGRGDRDASDQVVWGTRPGDRRSRTVVGIGQKSGVYWLLDARTGRLVWATLVGHGDDPGGIQWGSAFDGRRIYAAIGHFRNAVPYTLDSGETTTAGSWAALDPATGRIEWQTADPLMAPDLGALSVANGIVYAGSMAATGDQMYALDARSGDILWRFAAGGSVVAGPAIVDGVIYWGSGYARTGGVGNNRFFAFSVEGR